METRKAIPYLAELPTELYAHIIQFFDPGDAQQCVLALTRAAPFASIPTYHLFENIHVRQPKQAIDLYRRLRGAPQDAALVLKFSLETWTVDADVLVNLMGLLHNVQELLLFIGPNFAPEHLEDLFKTPRANLKYMSLRLRP